MMYPPLTQEKVDQFKKLTDLGFASITQEQAVRKLGFSSAAFIFLCSMYAFKN